MTSKDESGLDDELGAIRQEFIAALRLQTADFQQWQDAVLALSPAATDAARRTAHKIRGTAPMLGFTDLGVAASVFEECLASGTQDRTSVYASFLEALNRACEQDDRQSAGGDSGNRLTNGPSPANEAESGRIARVLLVEDDPVAARLYQTNLETRSRSITVATTAAQAESLLTSDSWDLLLTDLVLPDGDGRNLIVRAREDLRTSNLPIIAMTATHRGNQFVRSECYALGVDTFFEKPIDLATLAAAVSSKIKRAENVLREARRDSLTGLPNRAAFREEFGRAAGLASRRKSPLSVAFLDVDFFKKVNDTHGHGKGDEVLKGVARVLRDTLRKSDLVARYGGEEFVALLPDTNVADAGQAVEKALVALRTESFAARDGARFSVTFSAGVAPVEPNTPIDDALAEADRRLYEAKQGGRNRVHAASQLTTPQAQTEPRPEAAPGRLRVLLAEDDSLTAGIVVSKLQREGWAVQHCRDGMAADAAFTTGTFDVVLLDGQMPGMDGFEVLRRIRGNAANARVPIIMLTALGNETDIVRGLDLGANDYILKPFSPTELVARIRRHLRQPSAQA